MLSMTIMTYGNFLIEFLILMWQLGISWNILEIEQNIGPFGHLWPFVRRQVQPQSACYWLQGME